MFLALLASAAPDGAARDETRKAAREQDLSELRTRIEALKSELEDKQASRREARDALQDSERAISDANRALAALESEGERLRKQSRQLDEQRQALERVLAGQEDALGRVLAARQAGGAPDALRLALSGADPVQVARKLYYLTYVSRAAAELVETYRVGLSELSRLRNAASEQAERLAEVEAAQRADREKVLKERRERRRLLERLAGEIRKSRREIKVLRADEARLARIVEEIGRVLAAKPGAGFARVERIPEAGAQSGAFSSLRGRLRLPVRGELTGRFGAPRGAAGMEAKGVFIRAPEGEPVRSVAAGQVVFADWMRGFGNLLIVDHGEAYLSIYANNDSLLKQVGEAVGPGEPLATVGASGGNEQTGLYFELRHLGKAFDPLRWVKLK